MIHCDEQWYQALFRSGMKTCSYHRRCPVVSETPRWATVNSSLERAIELLVFPGGWIFKGF